MEIPYSLFITVIEIDVWVPWNILIVTLLGLTCLLNNLNKCMHGHTDKQSDGSHSILMGEGLTNRT